MHNSQLGSPACNIIADFVLYLPKLNFPPLQKSTLPGCINFAFYWGYGLLHSLGIAVLYLQRLIQLSLLQILLGLSLQLLQLCHRPCRLLSHQLTKALLLLLSQLCYHLSPLLLQALNANLHFLYLLRGKSQHIGTIYLNAQIQHLIKIFLLCLLALCLKLWPQLLTFFLCQSIKLMHQLIMSGQAVQPGLLTGSLLK